MKCRKHDKGRCFFGPKCNFTHASNSVCKVYSKLGVCPNEDDCQDRHPAGVCLQWRRALCEKGVQCFYQHPDKEYGSLTKDDSDKINKRKRSNSNEPSPSKTSARNSATKPSETGNNQKPITEHFLYERMILMEKELENYRRKNLIQHPPQPPMFMMARVWHS